MQDYIKTLVEQMTGAVVEYDENEVECDGCGKIMGYGKRTNKLVLCGTCNPEFCTTEALAEDGSREYWAEIGHRMEADKMAHEEHVRWDREYGFDHGDIPF